MRASNARKRLFENDDDVSTVKLGANRDVRLPEDVARTLKLRKGSRLGVVISGDTVVLVPLSRIRKDQRYFYTREWQLREREADEDIASGRVRSFDCAEDLIRDLRSP